MARAVRQKAGSRQKPGSFYVIGKRAPDVLASGNGDGCILVLYGRENYNGKARGADRTRG